MSGTSFYLASASPRRRDLLESLGIRARVRPVEIDETPRPGLRPAAVVEDLAARKLAAFRDIGVPADAGWVLTADTLVFRDGEPLGKPAGREDARDMLASLAGRDHLVATGVSLLRAADGRCETASRETSVSFQSLTAAELESWLDTEEWRGAAGSYRIQESGARFVSRIDGSWTAVMGLPIHLVYGMLKRLNYFPGLD